MGFVLYPTLAACCGSNIYTKHPKCNVAMHTIRFLQHVLRQLIVFTTQWVRNVRTSIIVHNSFFYVAYRSMSVKKWLKKDLVSRGISFFSRCIKPGSDLIASQCILFVYNQINISFEEPKNHFHASNHGELWCYLTHKMHFCKLKLTNYNSIA